jgi:hypothetical protein
MSLINTQGDNALNNAKYLNITADEVIQAYENLKLSPPIKIMESTQRYGIIERGWGNGYVRIAEGHPFYGKTYDDIPVSVHGGITFGEHIMDDSRWPDGYWIGFDTAHYGDNQDTWTIDNVTEETKDLLRQVYHLK